MEFLDIPEEIMVMITHYLDLQSLRCLYNTNDRLRGIIKMKGIVKEWNISLSVMATEKSFKLSMFKNVCENLQVLNLSGVSDLSNTTLIQTLRKLKCLKCLDVSYTNICILDLLSIPEVCPTLKDITTNFTFKKSSGYRNFTQTLLYECQTLFKQFENIHFIGTIHSLFHTKYIAFILQYTKLISLKYSISMVDIDYNEDVPFTRDPDRWRDKFPHFDNFFIYLLNWQEKEKIANYGTEPSTYYVKFYDTLTILRANKYASIVIVRRGFAKLIVYASPLFKHFLRKHFDIKAECINSLIEFSSNSAIMVWNKDTTHFNDIFFSKLAVILRPYFPQNVENDNFELSATKDVNWFVSNPTPFCITKSGLSNKKQNYSSLTFELDYDSMFTEKDKLELSVIFSNHVAESITISPESDYLKKLTFLSLSDISHASTHYRSDFFNILFRYCENLVTLNVQHCYFMPMSSASVAQNLPLSRSIKNVRLLDYDIDFEPLFLSVSQCKTLENLHVISYRGERWHGRDIHGDPCKIIENCVHLYNMYIIAPMTEKTRSAVLRNVDIAKKRFGKPYLNIALNVVNEISKYLYDPYMKVFRISPISPS